MTAWDLCRVEGAFAGAAADPSQRTKALDVCAAKVQASPRGDKPQPNRRYVMATALGGVGLTMLSKFGVAFAQSAVDQLITAVVNLESEAGRLGLMPRRTRGLPGERLNTTNIYLTGLPRVFVVSDAASGHSEAAALDSTCAEVIARLNEQERSPAEFFSARTRSPQPRYEAIKADYLKMFTACTVRSEYNGFVEWYVERVTRNRSRYEEVGSKIRAPWFFVGLIHALEASFNFGAHLHNGDYPLTQRTRHDPANRPTTWAPPTDWEASALDALTLEGFANLESWTISEILYRCERFNGFGYRGHGIPSPYLWSFSQYYKSGKYIADGRYDANAVSQQCGAAVLLKMLVDRKVINPA